MDKGPGKSSSNYIGLFIKNTLILFDAPPPPTPQILYKHFF